MNNPIVMIGLGRCSLLERYSDEDVLSITDELNQRPRRILGYHTPTELFDHFLDEVYAVKKCS